MRSAWYSHFRQAAQGGTRDRVERALTVAAGAIALGGLPARNEEVREMIMSRHMKDVARESLGVAADAVAELRRVAEEQAVESAEMITRMAHVNAARTEARDVLAGLSQVTVSRDGRPEEKPEYWVGRLEGALLGLVSAVDDVLAG